MNIGIIGLGKLGLPVAVGFSNATAGLFHKQQLLQNRVFGYDINPANMCKRMYTHKEAGFKNRNFQELFDKADISFVGLDDLVSQSDVIFVAVQTPHQPEYEGTTRLPKSRADFDYGYLVQAIKNIAPKIRPDQILVIISTVLPGTIRANIIPLLPPGTQLVYNPFFIAMGTVIQDFLNPEFVLLGSDNPQASLTISKLYSQYHSKPCLSMSIESAELTKVAYNTFISMKIAYANTLMEISHKTPNCDVDDVTNAIGMATDRLMSGKYLSGGMGDGGACHPRDNIAMSWLSRKLDLSHNLFEDAMLAREHQTEWLIDLIMTHNTKNLPIVILGKSFKPETNIITGSPAVLLSNILQERGIRAKCWDPYIDKPNPAILRDLYMQPSVYLIATKHEVFQNISYPVGSIIIDPHRYIKPRDGVEVVSVGSGKS